MSYSDCKKMFEESLFHIDSQSGACEFSLPLAKFSGHVSGLPLVLTLTGQLDGKSDLPSLNFYKYGNWETEGGHNYPTCSLRVTNVPLFDGRIMEAAASDNAGNSAVGAGYVFDATHLLSERKKKFPIGSDDFQQRALSGQSFTILHHSGVSEIFDCVGARPPIADNQSHVLIRELLEPTGIGLSFTWESPLDHPRIVKIADSNSTLLTAVWDRSSSPPKPKEIVIYPNSEEEIKYTFAHKKNTLTIEAVTANALVEKIVYTLVKSVDSKSLSTQIHYKDAFTSETKEVLAWKAGKPETHKIELADASEPVERYSWESGKTTVTLSVDDYTIEKKTFTFKNNQLVTSSIETDGSISTRASSFTVHKNNTATRELTYSVDGTEIEKIVSTYDREGNLTSVTRGNERIEWTYFNNYTQYDVSSEIEDHSETEKTFFMMGPLFTALSPFKLPGTTKRANFVTSIVKHFTTFRRSAINNYATSAFNLPVDINYPGDTLGFNAHVESERVITTDTTGDTTTKVTYFGYDKLVPKTHPLVDREHVIVLARKLTVLQPKLEIVDISDTQLTVAKSATKDILAALRECEKQAKDDEYLKNIFTNQIKNIQATSASQSKQNSTGFKLSEWLAASMSVEDFTYCTDTSAPYFGKLTSTTRYFLTADGKKINATELTSKMEYSVDPGNARKITCTTNTNLMKGAPSVQLRDGHAGTLRESTDTRGIKTIYTYDKGSLTNIKVMQKKATLSNLSFSYTADPETHTRELKATGLNGFVQCWTFDELGRELARTVILKEGSAAQKVNTTTYTKSTSTITHYIYTPQGDERELEISEFDSQGRPTARTSYDYRADGTTYSTLKTTWTWSVDSKALTRSMTLYDGDNKKIDSRTQTYSRDGDTITMTHGKHSEALTSDRELRTSTYVQESSKNKPSFKIERAFNTAGQPTSIEYFLDKKGTLTSQDAKTLEYNALGQVISLTQNSSTTLHATYDPMGRQLTHDLNGSVLRFDYASHNVTPTPSSISVESEGSPALELGYQEVDAFGRVRLRCVNQVIRVAAFDNSLCTLEPYPDLCARVYFDALPDWAKEVHSPVDFRRMEKEAAEDLMRHYLNFPLDKSEPLTPWHSDTVNNNALTYTETFAPPSKPTGTSQQPRSTQTTLSLRGQTIGFTDIADNTSTYVYDCLGRVIEQRSSVCVTKTEYGDDDRQSKETITDVTNNKTVSVTYTYDGFGREIARTFKCPTHTLKLTRSLTTEGRLKEQTLLVDDKIHSKDQYDYDKHGRLKTWKSENKGCVYQDQHVDRMTFECDALGNLTEFTANDVREIRSYSKTKPGFLELSSSDEPADFKGRLYTESITYSKNDRIISDEYYSYDYDTSSRLRHFSREKREGDEIDFDSENFVLHYRGDSVYARSHSTSTKQKLLSESHSILLNDSVGVYLHQLRSSRDLKKETVETRFELRDASGTVFATLDSSGTLSYHHYLPYGYREVDENWLGFNGECLLPNGKYLLGNYRLYDPELMTFLSPDSESPFGIGGPAAYAYCGGDPVNYHDPSGHSREEHFSYTLAPPIITTKEFRIIMAVAGIVAAPLGGGMVATALGMASGSLELASVLLEESDPELSSALAVLAFGGGLASMAAGVSGTARLGSAAARNVGTTPKARVVMDKTMAGMSGYRYLDEAVRLYEDTHKGVRRLVINMHGVADEAGQATGRVATTLGDLNAQEFVDFLASKGINPGAYKKIKLHSCYSASQYNSFGDSFGKDLARITGSEVKGYEGTMNLSIARGETLTHPCAYIDDPKIYELLASPGGTETLISEWRPRKIQWKRDASGLPMFDTNGAAIPESYDHFRPRTFRPREGSWQIEEVLGDHSYEKAIKRFSKNPSVYSDPYEEVRRAQRRLEGKLLDLLDGDSLC